MGIEWIRDLSITILGFVTTGVLIFAAVLFFHLYREARSVLRLVKATTQIVHDTVSVIQAGIKPLLSIMALIKGLSEGVQGIGKFFSKDSSEGGG